MKFGMHLSTRIQDKRDELPLINCLTDLAPAQMSADLARDLLTSTTSTETIDCSNALVRVCALAPRLKQRAHAHSHCDEPGDPSIPGG